MLPHHAELVHCSISWFLYYSTGSPSATETQELLSHCLWPGVNQTCWSSWFGPTRPFPCQLDHSITFFRKESDVLLFTIFFGICLSCQNSHIGRTLFLYAVKGFKHHADVSPCGQNRNLFVFFSNLSGKDVVITNLFQCTCPGCDWIPQMSSIDNSYRKIHQLVYSQN